jgi:hypothetical protein
LSSKIAIVPKEASQRSSPLLAFWALAPPADPVATVLASLEPVFMEDMHPVMESDKTHKSTEKNIDFLFI